MSGDAEARADRLKGAARARVAILVLGSALTVGALAWDLGGRALTDPDEGRNAEVAREMAVSGDFVLPRLNGLPYLDKPVLFFAVAAAFVRALGATEVAVRLPSLLFMLATVALAAGFGARLFGRAGGWIAGIATGASPLTIIFARTVIFDGMLTFFVSLALVSFYLAVEGLEEGEEVGREARRADARWTILAWAAIGLGVLTKGPVALALPLVVALPYAAWRRRARAVWHPSALLLFGAIIIPWVAVVSSRAPGFLRYVVLTETVERVATEGLHRNLPLWYFVFLLAIGALPWCAVAAAGFARGRGLREESGALDRRAVFLLLWLLLPFALFSISHAKRPQYILPLVPAVALLVACLWTSGSDRLPGAGSAAAALGALGFVLVLPNGLVPTVQRLDPSAIEVLPRTALGEGGVMLAAAAIAWAARRRWEVALAALSLPAVAIPFVGGDLIAAVSDEYSCRRVAAAIAPVLTPQTEIVSVAVFPHSLAYYLGRTLIVSTPTGGKLKSNYLTRTYDHWRQAPGTPYRPADWWKQAMETCETPRVFVVRSKDLAVRRALTVHMPLLVDTGTVAAYGPCRTPAPGPFPPGPPPR